MSNNLNPKQLRFIQEYLVDHNATQAAIRSGYSKKTAYSIGSENLTKPEIKAEVERREAEIAKKLEINAEDVFVSQKRHINLYDRMADLATKGKLSVEEDIEFNRLLLIIGKGGDSSKAAQFLSDHLKWKEEDLTVSTNTSITEIKININKPK